MASEQKLEGDEREAIQILDHKLNSRSNPWGWHLKGWGDGNQQCTVLVVFPKNSNTGRRCHQKRVQRKGWKIWLDESKQGFKDKDMLTCLEQYIIDIFQAGLGSGGIGIEEHSDARHHIGKAIFLKCLERKAPKLEFSKFRIHSEKKEWWEKRSPSLGRLTSDRQWYVMLCIGFWILGWIVRSSPIFGRVECSNSSLEDRVKMC